MHVLFYVLLPEALQRIHDPALLSYLASSTGYISWKYQDLVVGLFWTWIAHSTSRFITLVWSIWMMWLTQIKHQEQIFPCPSTTCTEKKLLVKASCLLVSLFEGISWAPIRKDLLGMDLHHLLSWCCIGLPHVKWKDTLLFHIFLMPFQCKVHRRNISIQIPDFVSCWSLPFLSVLTCSSLLLCCSCEFSLSQFKSYSCM